MKDSLSFPLLVAVMYYIYVPAKILALLRYMDARRFYCGFMGPVIVVDTCDTRANVWWHKCTRGINIFCHRKFFFFLYGTWSAFIDTLSIGERVSKRVCFSFDLETTRSNTNLEGILGVICNEAYHICAYLTAHGRIHYSHIFFLRFLTLKKQIRTIFDPGFIEDPLICLNPRCIRHGQCEIYVLGFLFGTM